MVKVTKKITKKLPVAQASVNEVVEEVSVPSAKEEVVEQEEKTTPKVKKCPFCQNEQGSRPSGTEKRPSGTKTTPSYTDIATLKRFISDRAKIVSRLRSGVCSKHQRTLSKQIKYARHLNLLPFTPKV